MRRSHQPVALQSIRGVWSLQREKDTNPRAMIEVIAVALNIDPPAVSFNELLGYEEANSRTDGRASGEESFEDPWQVGCSDPHAIVLNSEDNPLGLFFAIPDRNGEVPAMGHGIDRVRDEVRDDLHHFAATQVGFP